MTYENKECEKHKFGRTDGYNRRFCQQCGGEELPEVLVEELEDALTGVFGHSHAIARLALSVIAPYYEKQIAELKAQIQQHGKV